MVYMQLRNRRQDSQHSRHVMVNHGHQESNVGACSMKPMVNSNTRQLLESARQKLMLVEKERIHMKQLSKEEALSQGRNTSNLDWYDYSGCTKKHL